MCGFFGWVSRDPIAGNEDRILRQATRLLAHRGPDDEGYYVDRYARLGMRRLSIIDLETGQQPVTNETGTCQLVFNGEIYNYRRLRSRLQGLGHDFVTSGDSEVIVHAYEEYGEQCVDHLNGMFAFAIWDCRRRRLFLARDRVGIKPLYYWSDGRQLVFGSELKSVIAHPDVPRRLDLSALDLFLTLEYVPGPRTIFQGIRKLPPGHRLVYQDGTLKIDPYWEPQVGAIYRDEPACVRELAALLEDAVRLRMVSDVPLGAFLSGGIDSSTVVAFMTGASDAPVRTFSIGFDDPSYNELPYARMVAGYLDTEHREEVLQPDICTLAQRLVAHLDEPFGDFSVFPTFLVSQVARESVKVVLSGDGGDELFGGYDTYVAQGYDRFYRHLPRIVRSSILPALTERIPPQPQKKGLLNKLKRFVEGAALPAALQHTRWMLFMREVDKACLYRPELGAVLADQPVQATLVGHFDRVAHADALAQQQYVDIKTYLVDDILTKVDRMSMAASLEARVPMLDHRIVEFALRLPPQFKMRRGQTKAILRAAARDRLPEAVFTKPKQGFSIPMKHWLRGPLRPLMGDLLSSDTVRRRGYFEQETVARWVGEHLQGRANHSHRLWALMVFELWHQQVLERAVSFDERATRVAV